MSTLQQAIRNVAPSYEHCGAVRPGDHRPYQQPVLAKGEQIIRRAPAHQELPLSPCGGYRAAWRARTGFWSGWTCGPEYREPGTAIMTSRKGPARTSAAGKRNCGPPGEAGGNAPGHPRGQCGCRGRLRPARDQVFSLTSAESGLPGYRRDDDEAAVTVDRRDDPVLQPAVANLVRARSSDSQPSPWPGS